MKCADPFAEWQRTIQDFGWNVAGWRVMAFVLCKSGAGQKQYRQR